MSIVLVGSTSGSITLQEPAVAGSTVLTLPATSGNVVVDGATQTLTNKTLTSPTLTTPNINSAQFATVSGTAPIYACRAWVNFDGVSGTSIRGSGNISSVTRSSAGRYDVNFTTAMPDANYAVSAMLNGASGTGTGAFNANGLWGANNRAVGSLRVEFYDAVGPSGYTDSALCDVAIFR